MLDFSPLVKDDKVGRLANDSLIQKYNSLAQIFREIENRLPSLLESEPTVRLIRKMNDVRKKLSRSHYQVGFLGSSQFGKSTTFNNVLGIVKSVFKDKFRDVAPATSGAKVAMTSAVTRLRASKDYECEIRYLSTAQHESRIAEMYSKCGVSPDRPLKQILEYLDSRLKETAAAAPSDPEKTVDDEATFTDFEKLRNYLKAWDRFGKKCIHETSISEKVDYKRRRDFINHSETTADSLQNLLIADVTLEFPTTEISPELEMIDLPGLGASCWDNHLTNEFLRDVDGCLLFVSLSGNIDDISLDRMVKRLRRIFPNGFRQRVWVVYTYFDALQDSAIHGTEQDGKTVIHSIHGALTSKGLALDQVLFVGNGLFEKFAALDPSTNRVVSRIPTAEFEAPPWRLKTEHGCLQPPDGWRDFAPLAAAFERFAQDGGIGAARELMLNTISAAVKSRIEEEANASLDSVRTELLDLLTINKSRAEQGPERLITAMSWSALVQELTGELDWNPVLFEAPAERMIQAIQTLFDQVCPAGLPTPREGIVDNHVNASRALASYLESRLQTDLIQPLFGSAQTYLSTRQPSGARPLQVLAPTGSGRALRDIPTALDEASRHSESIHDARTTLLRDWESPHLFSPHNGKVTFEGIAEYRAHMHDRIKTFVYRGVHRVIRSIQRNLCDFDRQLQILETPDSGDSGGDYDAVISLL